MRILDISDEKNELVEATAMSYRSDMLRSCVQAKFWNELIDHDNETNGTDKASQERPRKNAVQEPKASEAGDEDDCTSHACHEASYSGMHEIILVATCPFVNGTANHLTDEKRASSFRANYHLRAATQESIQNGVEYERI